MFRAFTSGLRLAAASPKLLGVLWLLLLLAALPFGLAMQQEIEEGIGASQVEQDLRGRMDKVWLGEFHESSPGLGGTLQPERASRVDFLHNLDLLFGGRLFEQHRGLVAGGVGYALCWVLLLGGLIDRYARGGGRFVFSQFLAAGGRYFLRLFKLTLIAAPLYWGLFLVAKWGYGRIGDAVRDVTVEKTVLGYYLAAAIPLLLTVAVVMAVIDYARVAAVLEEEPGVLRALLRGFRFVVRQPVTVLGLALLVTLCSLGLIALRTLVTPSAGDGTALGIVGLFLLGQVFVVGRIILRLTLVAGEMSLYRRLR